jgi:hypothetical protein
MILPFAILAGVLVGIAAGAWWTIYAAAALAGAAAWLADDAATALAYALATAAGVGIGVAVRRRGPRSVPPPG